MKFPSIQTISEVTIRTCKRFPLAMIFMLIGCISGIFYNHMSEDITDKLYYYINIIRSAYLGMLMALAFIIYAERKNLTFKLRLIVQVIIVGLITAFYFSLPDHSSQIHVKQFILFVIGLHLFVAFVPFTAKGQVNGFWQYNKSLFLRFLSTVLYSCVLYIGLSLALLAINNLFKVEIRYKWYLDLWILIFCVFNTIYFLSGFPSGFEKLETIKDYPKGLKIFTQYILLPVIIVYLLILYAYTFKIIVGSQWPYGWVSYLVLAFSIAGIFSLLLFYPIKDEAQNKWILLFSRFFYIAICPLIILLFLAIQRRISEYGITEERYFVLGLSCWLAFITVYFLFSKKKNIKIIPVTLCMIAFLISFGPWGAFSVSFSSQRQRLLQLLRANNMLSENQKLIPAKTYLHNGDARQIKSIIEYLVEAHGYHSLQPLFSLNLDSMMKDQKGKPNYYAYEQSEKLVEYTQAYEYDTTVTEYRNNFFRISPTKNDTLISLSGYEYQINGYTIHGNSDDSLIRKYIAGNISIQVEFIKGSGKILFNNGKDLPVILEISDLLKSLKIDTRDYAQYINQGNLIISGENNGLAIKCIIKDISGDNQHDSTEINSISADILIHLKSPPRGIFK